MKPYLAVARQVPEFVRAEYPAFVEFLEAYYKWLEEEYSVGKVGHLVDLDSTIDGYLQYFRKQLDIHGITAQADDKTYLKNIKQLYTSKGSFAGIEFLFKILYDKPSRVIQPWDYVFKPSEGQWNQDTSILVDIEVGNVNNLRGTAIIVKDTAGRTYKTYVRDTNHRRTGVDELFVSRFTPQSRLVSFTTEDDSVQGTILNTTTKARVTRPGEGFRIGQVFAVDSATGSGTLIKVKAVDENGGIRAVELITFGTGYASDFNAVISPTDAVDLASLGSYIQLGEFTYVSNDNASAQGERGEIIRHDYTNLNTSYVVDPTYVGETVGEIKSHENVGVTNNTYAIINFNVGSLCVYPGYYLSGDNIVGDTAFIQDSNYYQIYSYVTSVEETLDKYGALLRKVLHPAGTKHFANYLVDNEFQLGIQIDPQLNLIQRADALRDFIDTVDQIRFAIAQALTDTATTTDTLVSIVISYVRSFSDSSTVADSSTRQIQPRYNDAVDPNDTFARVFSANRTFTETSIATHSVPIFTLGKVRTSTAVVTDVFAAIGSFNGSFTTSLSGVTDSIRFSATESLSDTTSISDNILIIPGIGFEDSFVVTHSVPVLQSDKYSQDAVQTANGYGSGIFMEPYYVLPQDPLSYWEPGYLENERAITN